jgi:endonuclease YncB( thermonuclease family)
MSTRARWPTAGGGTFLIFLAVAALWPDDARTQVRAAGAASACREVTFASAVVQRAMDGRTIMLDDGREVRLAGIETPGEGAGAAAQAFLHTLLAGKSIVLKGSPERDRYGRLAAQVFMAGTAPERWVEAELLAAGHARVSARVGERACAAELARHERAAREARLGLWSDASFAPRTADDPAAVANDRGRFTLVEGNVLSVRESGGTIYMNFGRRWSEDFTVTIAKRNERLFTAAGIEPKTLAGRRVRVRGWIEERGGPWVEATRPEQIEVVERN